MTAPGVDFDHATLDPDLAIIDAHHHLFDRPGQRYLLDDYLADIGAGHRIVASVYVETQAFIRADGPELLRSLGEIEFANGVAAMSASGIYGDCRVCAAIVGYADLRLGDEVAELLDRALAIAPDRLRGMRQVTIEDPTGKSYRYMMQPPPSGILSSAGFRPAFRHLAARGLTFDAAVFDHQLPDIGDLADAFPDTTIVLNHMGAAMALDLDAEGRAEVFSRWRAGLRDVSRRQNVICKIGGLGMPLWGFGFESRSDAVGYPELASAWRPYVETALEAFGPRRCMMESNFPPDRRSCGFTALWNALKHIVRDCSASEKAALFRNTAAGVYRIDVSRLSGVNPMLPS